MVPNLFFRKNIFCWIYIGDFKKPSFNHEKNEIRFRNDVLKALF